MVHIAIDDTYGPEDLAPTRYVTGARRTYVAVEFLDTDVDEVRGSVRECLQAIPQLMGVVPTEFHFVDIYNRKGVWKDVSDGRNLRLFQFFADIYRRYRWRVHVQTVDERTLSDHGLQLSGTVDGIDMATRDGQALFFLLVKLKQALQHSEQVVLRIDAGRRKPGATFAKLVFHEWGNRYDGSYVSSNADPLIQIADFLAFSINRSTYLQMKDNRSETDLWFLDLVGRMGIRSSDLVQSSSTPKNLTADVKAGHAEDRRRKGLE